MATREVKVVFLGDAGVGKTSLLLSYAYCTFPLPVTVKVADEHKSLVMIDDKPVSLTLIDTKGEEHGDFEFDSIYQQTDVFVVCYDILRPQTLENVRSVWHPGAIKHEPNAQFVIIGTKFDVLQNVPVITTMARNGEYPVTARMAHDLGKEVGSYSHFQTSSLDHERNGCLVEIFKSFVRAKYPPTEDNEAKSSKCSLQ